MSELWQDVATSREPNKDTMDLRKYIQVQKDWSEIVFGEGSRTEGILEHIRLESDEVRAEPNDVEEWVDIAILALDGAWRAGHSPEEVCEAMLRKQIKNLKRQWHVPESGDKPVTHIKS